ncbi:bifunctional hydroxymethylpyrimidine kinase/phosphomethylpyrimidine kinase [Qipengyuania sp. GH1]|uniref:bifunctional hydroxymethylpyrimidine kinase/phosphomethylpyrimidine kinase n=1 Tax=Qipengyuania aestuarii TaxID=2867241 RepID=UPI001C86708A|nr:bifunctional hydroxymethylpyrimidine kinase/phosphomethylpyrimidine kinase [Qipengyuania aestuarii]MBX7536213.1 bifunctional hydroxymethylpyrimidine kinase/phosphomethylpyrimidine kinase [Qipengyuania aestuarii]
MTETQSPPRILSIAGSDSSGGAGIQADIKTITMLGGYAMTAITAVTAQNTTGVQAVEVFDSDFVMKQVESCLDDLTADAIKIGMLGSPEIALRLAERLDSFAGPIVFDPVMIATSGAVLADEATIDAFGALMQIATAVTPNLPELAALTGRKNIPAEEIFEAARELAETQDTIVLAKGGHSDGDQVIDYVVSASGRIASFGHERIETRHTHGTGCTLSSALATMLAHGQPLTHAVRIARAFTRAAIEQAPGYGSGNGPLGHQSVRKLEPGEAL